MISVLRDHLAQQPDISVKIDRPQLFSFSTPLEIELSGYELTQLKTAADTTVSRPRWHGYLHHGWYLC